MHRQSCFMWPAVVLREEFEKHLFPGDLKLSGLNRSDRVLFPGSGKASNDAAFLHPPLGCNCSFRQPALRGRIHPHNFLPAGNN